MKAFYADIVRGKKVALLAGPFPDEATARKYERAASAKAMEIDPWAHFDPFGVVAVDTDKLGGKPLPLGKLNHLLAIEPADLMEVQTA